MTQEDISKLVSLYPKFADECDRVGNILCKVYWEANRDYSDAGSCHTWTLDDKKVYGRGFDSAGDYVTCEFPLDCLTMSDQQLYDLVEQINEDYRKKKEEKKRREAEQLKKKELAELKRLQEKYKGETLCDNQD